ncbi:MAG: hypothetical protein ACE37N_11935 [Pseudohongiellaceae bacterium]
MEALLQLAIFFTLLALGYLFGRRAESKHYKAFASARSSSGTL